MTPKYKSQHVGDNVGTHKDCTAKGPALNHQDAEWGLQVRLLRQVLGVEERNCVFEDLGKRERQPQTGREKIHLNLYSKPSSATASLCNLW